MEWYVQGILAAVGSVLVNGLMLGSWMMYTRQSVPSRNLLIPSNDMTVGAAVGSVSALKVNDSSVTLLGSPTSQ